jgi:hypothetical protein
MTAELTAAAPELAATALRTVREEFPNGLYVHHTQPGDASPPSTVGLGWAWRCGGCRRDALGRGWRSSVQLSVC